MQDGGEGVGPCPLVLFKNLLVSEITSKLVLSFFIPEMVYVPLFPKVFCLCSPVSQISHVLWYFQPQNSFSEHQKNQVIFALQKDKLVPSFRSKGLYKANSWDCNDFCIGKTKRRLRDRKTENLKALTTNCHESAKLPINQP